MRSTDSEGHSCGQKRTDGARLIVRSLDDLAQRRGLVLDEVSWFTHPSEDAALGTYTLLVCAQQRLEELVFEEGELECLPHSAYARKRIAGLLQWLVDELQRERASQRQFTNLSTRPPTELGMARQGGLRG